VNGYYILNDIFLHTGVAGPPPLIPSNLQPTDQGMDLSPNAGWHSMMPDQIATIPNHPMMNMNDQQYGYYDAYKRPVYDVTPSHMIPSNNGMKPPFQPTPQEFIPHTDHHTHTTQNDAYLNITRPGQPSFPRDKEVTSEPHSAVSTASSKPPVNNSRSRHNPVDTDSISSRPLSPPRKRSASRSKSASHTNAVSTATSTSPLQSANEQVPSPAAPKDNHAAGIANHPTNILSEVKPSKKKDVNVKSIAAIPRSRLEHQSSEIAHNGSDKAQNSLGVNLPQKASPSSTVLAGSSTKTQSPIKESHDSTPVVDNHIPTEPTGSASRMRIKSPRKAIPSGVQTTESITTSVVGESTQTAITAASNNQNDLPEISSNSIPPSKQKEAFTRPTDSQKTESPSTGPKSWASMASNPTTKWSPSLSAASAITPITVAPVTQGRNQHRGTQGRLISFTFVQLTAYIPIQKGSHSMYACVMSLQLSRRIRLQKCSRSTERNRKSICIVRKAFAFYVISKSPMQLQPARSQDKLTAIPCGLIYHERIRSNILIIAEITDPIKDKYIIYILR